MTPGELTVIFRQKCRDEKERQRVRDYNNYTLACLVRSAVWGKEMPGFEKVFPDREKKPEKTKEMSDEELLKQVEALNRLFGGVEE